MTDLHCHILPGVDDGAKTVEDSLLLLRAQQKDGVKRIALTSHFHSERTTVEEFAEKRQAALEQLQTAVAAQGMEFEFKLGAEVYFSPKLCDLDTRSLCMEGTDFMLVEFPTSHRPHFIRETFYQLQSQGVVPLIAHVERYPYVLHDPTLLHQWVSAGAYAQMNAGSLLKGGKYSALLWKLLSWDLVQVLSTDTHSMEKRPPRMAQALAAVEKKLGAQAARQLAQNGDALFHNEEPDVAEPHLPHKVLNWWV